MTKSARLAVTVPSPKVETSLWGQFREQLSTLGPLRLCPIHCRALCISQIIRFFPLMSTDHDRLHCSTHTLFSHARQFGQTSHKVWWCEKWLMQNSSVDNSCLNTPQSKNDQTTTLPINKIFCGIWYQLYQWYTSRVDQECQYVFVPQFFRQRSLGHFFSWVPIIKQTLRFSTHLVCHSPPSLLLAMQLLA